MNNKILISPSILSGDFANLERVCNGLIVDGADMIHCDVMDGIFVPNLTFGMPVVRAINKVCDGFLDVHLMIVEPERYVEEFVDAGADMVTFHIEQSKPAECIKKIKAKGAKCGITLKPSTPIDLILPYINQVDMVLIMSVEPGFSGQKFMPEAIDRIAKIRSLNSQVKIQVDGGITLDNVNHVIDAGANVIVAGNTVFLSNNRAETINLLRGQAHK